MPSVPPLGSNAYDIQVAGSSSRMALSSYNTNTVYITLAYIGTLCTLHWVILSTLYTGIVEHIMNYASWHNVGI